MSRLRLALATSAVLGLGAACGYGGDATGTDGGVVGEAGIKRADAQAPDGVAPEGGPAPDGAGVTLLDVTSSTPAAQVDLDGEGTLGWIHWGYDTYTFGSDPHRSVSKASAASAIPPFTLDPGNDLASFSDGSTTFLWAMGSGPASGADHAGVYLKDMPTFRLQVSAGATPHRLVIYAGSHQAGAQLTVKLGGAPTPSVAPFPRPGFNGYIRYAIDFAAAENTLLDVVWTMTDKQDANSNITLSAATLSLTP